MKKSKFSSQSFQRFFCILLFAFCILSANAQSTNIDFPTAVSTNEINGIIPARDVGDPRLTSYYYTFNGNQGDIFINVSTANFTGDIEVFVAEGLRSLSKISVFADSPISETGRIIYLRKPEKLILRVQGRTPDDNPAKFTIKFAGSFVAVQRTEGIEEPKLPEIKTQESSGIRVNSVGTIIEVKPKPSPVPAESVAERKQPEAIEEAPAKAAEVEPANKTDEREKNAEANNVSEETKSAAAEKPVVKKPAPRRAPRRAAGRNTAARNTRTAKTPPVKVAPKTPPKETPPNPLENVHLRVFLKTGEELDFAMTEVFRFTMNNGVLIITMKNGKIHRYPIVDTQRIVIE